MTHDVDSVIIQTLGCLLLIYVMIIINIYSHIFPIYVFLQYSVAADAIWPDFSPSQKLDTHSSVFIAKAYAILATIKYIVG